MRSILIAAALVLAAGSASAVDYVARNEGGDTVRISDRPCLPEILAQIPEAERPLYHGAVATIGGHDFRACWRVWPEVAGVHMRYEDGDQGIVPFSDLKEDPGT